MTCGRRPVVPRASTFLSSTSARGEVRRCWFLSSTPLLGSVLSGLSTWLVQDLAQTLLSESFPFRQLPDSSISKLLPSGQSLAADAGLSCQKTGRHKGWLQYMAVPLFTAPGAQSCFPPLPGGGGCLGSLAQPGRVPTPSRCPRPLTLPGEFRIHFSAKGRCSLCPEHPPTSGF